MSTFYCTEEDVRSALESKSTGYDGPAIRRAIANGSDDVDDVSQLAAGAFRPVIATRAYRWPDPQTSYYYRLWLDGNPLISLSSLVSGGTVIPPASCLLEPQAYGPPYDRIEVDLSTSDAFGFAGTPQRAINATGLWGFRDDREPGGTLAADVNDSATTITVSDGSLVGVYDHLIIGTERLEVTGRTWTTGSATAAFLSASVADRAVHVVDGTAYHAGELILIDSERLLVVDIAGNTLTALRAQDGSVLATHANPSTPYVSRVLTVSRGAQGSTAAGHLTNAVIARHVVPGAVKALNVASALATLLGERSGYAREAGPSTRAQLAEPRGTALLRERVASLYGHQARTRVV